MTGAVSNVYLRNALDEAGRVTRLELRKEVLLSFLDRVFKETDIDLAPEKRDVKYTRETWLLIHEEYEDFCKKCHEIPLSYSRFTIIR